jgi:hypothetical protein
MLNIFKFIFNPDWFTFNFGGGGGGGGPNYTYSQTSNIPEYAKPYVQRMLGSTEKEIYEYGPSGNITGFRPFKPYAEYDIARGGTGETVAPFSPMQKRSIEGIANYQLPGQTEAASQAAGAGTLGSLGAGQQYAQQATNPFATQAYMSPYMEGALAPQMREAARQSAIEGQRQQAQAVQAGAFGGSRQGLVEAERQRNLGQLQADIYGKGMQTAFEQARDAQKFGSELGLRGYGQALEGAGRLGSLGQQQYQQELGLMGQQFEMGSKQQQYEQARLNQIIQDYATAQQYPFLQLSMLNNMLRGLPMQASTTQMYQAQPSYGQQAVGAAGTLAMMNQAMKAEGGAIKEMKGGGIASGVDPNELNDMMKKLSDAQLRSKLNPQETDPETLGIAQAEQQRRDQVRAGIPKAANGGIIAFKEGDAVKNPFSENKEEKEEPKPPVASRPKAAAPRPAADPSPYQTAYKQEIAKPSAITPEISSLRALRDVEQAEASLTPEQFIARKQEAYTKLGIDPKQIYLNNKKDKEEALVAAKGDAERAQYMRWAQAFAIFGSTPGPELKAGLMALNSVLPDILEDQKTARAYQRELKTSIFELDKAELLREQGMVDDAFKQQQEARARAAGVSIKLGDLVAKEQEITTKTKAELAGREVTGQYGLAGDRVKAAAQAKGEERRLASEERRARESEAKQERQSKQSALQFYKDQTKGDKEQLDRLRNNMSIVTDPKEKEKHRAAITEIENRHRAIAAQAAATFNVDLSELTKSAEPPAAGEIKFTNPEAAEAFKQYK